jgi:hypothetical protein
MHQTFAKQFAAHFLWGNGYGGRSFGPREAGRLDQKEGTYSLDGSAFAW